MSPRSGFHPPKHQTRYEIFEERIVLSAHPLPTLWLDPFESESLESPYSEVAPALQGWNSLRPFANGGGHYGLDGSGQTVAVIDSGIAYDHQSLGGGFGDGFRVVGGWDFAENDADPYDDGPAGFHGTHVAGIVGGDDDKYMGVASGVDLVALRVFDDNGYGSFSWVEQALQWVHEHQDTFRNPITTVNLSLGTDWNSHDIPNWAMLEDEFKLLNQDGIFVSVAAGNSFRSYLSPGLSYPASSPFVVPVASHGSDGQLSDFSQRNNRVLTAPGEQIVSAIPGYLVGRPEATNRFMGASGTSMAAPYVAGASTLVREAMDFMGYQDVDAERIHDHMRATADLIYDAVTDANYHSINLERALDSLMADDYGDVAESAFHLGNWSTTHQWSGVIGTPNDIDCFTLTAASTGVLQLSWGTGSDLQLQWQVDGLVLEPVDGKLLIDVQEGQTYHLAVESTAGLGRYNVTGTLVPVQVPAEVFDMGAVSSNNVDHLSIDETLWVRAQATHGGTLTWEASAEDHGRIDAMRLFDAYGNELGITHEGRLDVEVQDGEIYLLRIDGSADRLTLKATNLIEQSGGQLQIHGTSGDDQFCISVKRGFHIEISGTSYFFSGRTINEIRIDGAGGEDEFSWAGTKKKEVIHLADQECVIQGRRWRLEADQIQHVDLQGGGGNDRVQIHDSSGNDHLSLAHRSFHLSSDHQQLSGQNIRHIEVVSNAGNDVVEWRGSRFKDKITIQGLDVLMSNKHGSQRVSGFDQVEIDATQGGKDRLQIYDSNLDDLVRLSSRFAQVSSDEYDVTVHGVSRVKAISSSGGTDRLELTDTLGKDRFVGRQNSATMRGDGYWLNGTGFGDVSARSSGQWGDQAYLHGSKALGSVQISPENARIEGGGFSMEASGFQQVFTFDGKLNNSSPLSTRSSALMMRMNLASLTSPDGPARVVGGPEVWGKSLSELNARVAAPLETKEFTFDSREEFDLQEESIWGRPTKRDSINDFFPQSSHAKVFTEMGRQAERARIDWGPSDDVLQRSGSDFLRQLSDDFDWLESAIDDSLNDFFSEYGRRSPR